MRCVWVVLVVNAVTAIPLSKQTLYDENEARKLLNMAAAAYGTEHEDCLNRTFPSHEERTMLLKTKLECDHLDNTCESFIVQSSATKELTVVFRGTKTKEQLLLEGLASIHSGVDFFDMGNVNKYFINAHLVLWPDLETILNDEKYTDHSITFTGHSLGGALAALAVARTVKQGFRRSDQVKIYTFGEPRVGGVEFAKNFDSLVPVSFRVVFRRDIVPHLPACEKDSANRDPTGSLPCSSEKSDAYHHGTEIWYPDSMSIGSHYVECVGEPRNEDFKCSDQMKFYYDQYKGYIWDHRHYFGVRVPEYGKTGCDISQPEGKAGLFERALCWFSPTPDCEEHLLTPEEKIPVSQHGIGGVWKEKGIVEHLGAQTMDVGIPSAQSGNRHGSVISRARESPWRAVPMDEALEVVDKYALEPCYKYAPVAAIKQGRIIAESIISLVNIPATRTSIKDGYAVIASDGSGLRRVVGTSTAGAPFQGVLTSNNCIRISTGAVVPDSADAVVQVENTKLVKHNGVEELEIEISGDVVQHQDIRNVGSDVSIGDVLVEKGCVIGPAEIGVLAGSGQRAVAIYRRPKVCVMSTGNELVDACVEDVCTGQIRDTNRPQLAALFDSLGFKPIDAGIAPDTREHLADSIRVALQFAHVLVTSGGVSMGEKDLLKDVLMHDLGFQIQFGRVMMKPGLPTTFATGCIDGEKKLVFALPGNPVSSYVTACLFVVPPLNFAAGRLRHRQTEIKVKLSESVRLDSRPEYRRAWMRPADDRGLPWAVTTGNQISSRLMSVCGANLLLVLPGRTEVAQVLDAGTVVSALIIGQL